MKTVYFEYRISSISDDWISNGSNSSISLTRLPPGRYKLDVRYTNGDRVWCKSMFSLNIRMNGIHGGSAAGLSLRISCWRCSLRMLCIP